MTVKKRLLPAAGLAMSGLLAGANALMGGGIFFSLSQLTTIARAADSCDGQRCTDKSDCSGGGDCFCNNPSKGESNGYCYLDC